MNVKDGRQNQKLHIILGFNLVKWQCVLLWLNFVWITFSIKVLTWNFGTFTSFSLSAVYGGTFENLSIELLLLFFVGSSDSKLSKFTPFLWPLQVHTIEWNDQWSSSCHYHFPFNYFLQGWFHLQIETLWCLSSNRPK